MFLNVIQTGTRIWPDFTAPANYTSGDGKLVNGKFRCYSCAGTEEYCYNDQTKHLGKTFVASFFALEKAIGCFRQFGLHNEIAGKHDFPNFS